MTSSPMGRHSTTSSAYGSSTTQVARWRSIAPQTAVSVSDIRRWKAEAIEREKIKAKRRLAGNRAGASPQVTLPSLGGGNSRSSHISSSSAVAPPGSAQQRRLPAQQSVPRPVAARSSGRSRQPIAITAAATAEMLGRGHSAGSSMLSEKQNRPLTPSLGGRGHPSDTSVRASSILSAPQRAAASVLTAGRCRSVAPPERGRRGGPTAARHRETITPTAPSPAPLVAAAVPQNNSTPAGKHNVERCDACDGPHRTDLCPLYKGKARDNHKDARGGRPKDIGAGSGGNFTLSKGREVRMPGDGSCLFHSLCYGLGKGSAHSLRQEIAGFISRNGSLSIAGDTLKEWIEWDGGGSVSACEPGCIRLFFCLRADVKLWSLCLCVLQPPAGSIVAVYWLDI